MPKFQPPRTWNVTSLGNKVFRGHSEVSRSGPNAAHPPTFQKGDTPTEHQVRMEEAGASEGASPADTWTPDLQPPASRS